MFKIQVLGLSAVLTVGFAQISSAIPVELQVNAKSEEILQYKGDAAAHLNFKSGSEKRANGTSGPFQGVLLQSLVELALSKVPLEIRSQVDLIILKDQKSDALIPRSFVNKFPIVLSKKGSELESVVLNWQSNSKMKAEDLPVETYFHDSVKSVVLTSYREKFSKYYLVRRTDPAAMRGEKIFTQACLSCHATGIGPDPSKWTSVELNGMKKTSHPPKMPRFELNDKMIRALVSYWEAQTKAAASTTAPASK